MTAGCTFWKSKVEQIDGFKASGTGTDQLTGNSGQFNGKDKSGLKA